MKRLPCKQFSRLLALVLVLVLMISTFAGCFSNTDPTEPSDSQSATDGTDATEGTDATDPTGTEPTDPPATEPEAVMGTVNTDKLNVRTKANSNSPSVNKLAIGTRLEILEQLTVEDVTWGRIAEGWVNMKYVTLDGETGETGGVVEDPGTTEPTPDETTPEETTTPSTGSGTMGTVTADSLHVRKGPGTKYDSVGKVKKGDRVEILETDGNWGKTSEGWISLKYVKLDGSSDTAKTDDSKKTEDEGIKTLVTDGSTTALGKVVIDTSALYVRYGPGTKYAVADKVYEDETVTYYQKSGNWVRIKEGWISLSYVKDASSSGSSATYKTGTGKVTASALYVREGAGTSYKSVDKVYEGDTVEILEVSGNWGRIAKGWICLDYVDMD
ncbi:MAG: SH3 domain-containing protein [Oscillospiraceae bacterium]|nr:SH3 domain-containing protein [Oscillospiraceae bacterium]